MYWLKQCARHAHLAVSRLPRLPYAPDPKDNWNQSLESEPFVERRHLVTMSEAFNETILAKRLWFHSGTSRLTVAERNNRLGVFLDTFSTRKKYPPPARSGCLLPPKGVCRRATSAKLDILIKASYCN
jgi:hypothetical protein